MFHPSRALAVLRDLAMRFVSVESALAPIQRLLAEQAGCPRGGDAARRHAEVLAFVIDLPM